MSERAIRTVWDYSQQKGPRRLLMLAIAQLAEGDSLTAIAPLLLLQAMTRRTARGVRADIRRLVDADELVVQRDRPDGIPRYVITLSQKERG